MHAEFRERIGKCQKEGCDAKKNLTLDHIVPLSWDGIDEESNWQVLCRQHNLEKADKAKGMAKIFRNGRWEIVKYLDLFGTVTT